MKRTDPLRKLVLDLLRGGGAHARAEEALTNFRPSLRGAKPRGSPHTPWEILEHMRIAHWDLLQYSRVPGFRSPKWPEGYWPATSAPPDSRAWARSARAFLADRRALMRLAADPRRDLLVPLRHAPEATLLLELFLAASHNSYHLGQLVLLLRMMEKRGAGKRRA
jgi:hypothetical protein